MREVRFNDIRGREQVHCIYEREEADELSIDYVDDWRLADQGEWILTDDGFVVQILKKGMAGGKKYVRTCTGTFPVGQSLKIDTEPREDRYRFGGKKGVSGSKNLTERMKMVLRRIVREGMSPAEAYMSVYVKAKPLTATNRMSNMLKTKEVREFMKKETEDLMKKLGMDHEWILRNYKKLIDDDGTNENAKVSALKQVSEISGLFDKDKSEKTQVFLGISEGEIARIRDSRHKEIQAETESADGEPSEADDGGSEQEVHEGESLHLLGSVWEEAQQHGAEGVESREDSA